MISVVVQSIAKKAADILAANSSIMGGVFSAINAAGIDQKDMQTNQFNVGPVWQNGRLKPDQQLEMRAFKSTICCELKSGMSTVYAQRLMCTQPQTLIASIQKFFKQKIQIPCWIERAPTQ